jgi:hypothetical protein
LICVLYTGAGKSKIISALLWHLFQYDASHLVMVTSYTWKAATLIGTQYNPGFSSSTAFGINLHSKRLGVFHSTAASRALLNPSVVMIINDEISFTDQAHLHVCVEYTYVMQ